MKRSGLVSAFALVLVAALGTAVFAFGGAAASSSPALPRIVLTDLVIEPSAQHESAYECTATIIDARTGETLAAPKVLFPSGEDAKVRSGVALDGRTANLDVIVSANAEDRTARVLVELVEESGSTTVQQLRVRL